jgi:chromosome segregation ATPase
MSEHAFNHDGLGQMNVIQIPTELPPPPNLTDLPAQVLHAGTIETLIGQNDDLMARLKVNIRRNGLLEQQIMAHDRTHAQLMGQNASLMSQLQILEEKDNILRDKANRAEGSQSGLKSEIEFLQAKIGALEDRATELKKSERFARRVRKWVTPFIDRLHAEIALKDRELLKKEAQISDLRARLSETTNIAQTIERRFSRDQSKLVETYEASSQSMANELERLRSESKLLRDKAQRLDQVTVSEAEARNKIVALERQAQDALKIADQHRREAKTLSAQAATRNLDLETALTNMKAAEESRAVILDQFESLQAVWAESQKRLENAKLQHETLNRLNQELSRQLKEQRKASGPIAPEANC